MTQSSGPKLPRVSDLLRDVRVQLLLLGGLVGIVVLALLITDLATGGDAEPPASLGADTEGSPGTGAGIPTLPAVTPTQAPTPVNEAEALARDTERLTELPLLQAALAEYRDRFDNYPVTDGRIETFCHYKDIDKGCDLKEVLDDNEEGILADPLGPANGYWLASDGKTYTIWMLREGPGATGDPICAEIPPGFSDSLFCVASGAPP